MSGADEQHRDTRGRRGWWLVGVLAVSGAGAGAFAGSRLDPDVSELVPSLAAAGFGLGGVIGLLLLAPVGLWRAWRRRRARRRAAASEPADLSARPLDDPERESAPAREPAPEAGVEDTEPPTPQEQEEPARETPEPEPADPPPPAGEEPGWYPDPARDGVRRYWDGHAWTGHVWRGRARERARDARNRR